jgi:hypothetical protein
MATVTESQLRVAFFEFLFGEQEGYVCIAVSERGEPQSMRKTFRQAFFHWPDQKDDLSNFVDEVSTSKHVWFGVNLFERTLRRTEYALAGRLVYADLDACNPEIVTPKPSIALETSPGRYHAVWRLDQRIDPDVAADYSRRIAYKYSVSGADKSGWDITQLLRVPYTRNFKYDGNPEVKVVQSNEEVYSPLPFEVIEIPPGEGFSENGQPDTSGMPELSTLPNPEYIIYKYMNESKDKAHHILKWYYTEPEIDDDWSGAMWRIINSFIEEGAEAEEVFSIALNAKCNKYERDGRPIRLLWKEVQKAFFTQKKVNAVTGEHSLLHMPDIGLEKHSETFVDQYLDWTTEATDANEIFHELAAFIVLSAIYSSNVSLEVNWGTLVPNLWGMILGESTLTRKTTAMRYALDVINHVDTEIHTASDGTVEGLLQALSVRPSMASLFFRDEVSGFFDAINRKDYLAGMVESLTHLYDVPTVFRRVLRRDVFNVERPVLIFFAGGIQDKVFSLLNDEYILSGFLPRFLIVCGNTDVSKIRSTSAISSENVNKREAVYRRMAEGYARFNRPIPIKVAGQSIQKYPSFKAELTRDAWVVYQDIEHRMTIAANDSNVRDLALPTFERLVKSMLKMAVLLASSRQEPDGEKLEVSEGDVRNAAYYVQRWGPSSIMMMYNAGKTTDQRIMDRVRNTIENRPGILRSDLMRNFRLNKRQMDMLIDTIIDRGEIRVTRKGRAIHYWPI